MVGAPYQHPNASYKSYAGATLQAHPAGKRSGRVIEIDVCRVPWTGTMSASASGLDRLGSGLGPGPGLKEAEARVTGHSPRLYEASPHA